jgi:myo-inositol-1(or 4)-monophosphatase
MTLSRRQLAEQLAVQVGNFALKRSTTTLEVTYKDKFLSDPVTNVDKECEQIIIEAIQKHFPEDGIIGEEGGLYTKNPKSFWVIDPLDGTQNYMHHLPLYCVSIAYIQDNHPELAAIYAPVFDELYIAQKGKGATLNGRKITVSEEIQDFSRHFGTAALSIAWVACGRLSYYKAHELFPWDFAAGSLIVQEANGISCTLENTPLVYFQPQSFFASNQKIKNKHFEGLL